ncbi:hypothetical protein [Microcoleus sp. FACHB-672]|uniref:hypothetical protein n=1 Tax=Microcoleus sp. FACHB-672 TaxID=2692825 RepID=UPI001687F65A|nr:hypothetical protein [Microcoleus sp. FACHB-672]MBD2039230.1 hypothetical protein [Microcoleus sp. FACHB-672]
MNSLTYEILKSRISNNCWLGKELFSISEQVSRAIQSPVDWFQSLTPIQSVKSQTDSAFSPIHQVIDSIKESSDIVTSVGLLFLESSYSINKSFNSRTHSFLSSKGSEILANLKIREADKRFYGLALEAHNETLNLPALSTKLEEVELQIQSVQNSGQQVLDEYRDRATSRLNEIKSDVEAQIQYLTGEAKLKAQRILYRINSIFKRIQSWGGASSGGSNSSTAPYIFSSRFSRGITSIRRYPDIQMSLAPIAGGAIATIPTIISVIKSISDWLLGSFLLKAVAGFQQVLLPALTHTVTSIVVKFFSISGAEACRYLAAGVLKQNIALLPAIFATTGTAGNAWAFLTAYAPYILIAAIIIIAAIKLSRSTQLGNLLYVFAIASPIASFSKNNTSFAFGQARVSGEPESVIRQELKTVAERILVDSTSSYVEIYGFALEDDKTVTLGLNLTNLNLPIPIPEGERDGIFMKLNDAIENFWE